MAAIARPLGVLLVIIGALALAAGIIYFVEPAKSLPSFIPGHIAGSGVHHDKRGVAGVVVGAVVFIIGGILLSYPSRRARIASY